MKTKAESYLKRAEEFEAMARGAQADAAKIAYEHLAWSYRQLGLHASRDTKGDAATAGLPERIVATGKEAR
jgi:hypothetical protein